MKKIAFIASIFLLAAGFAFAQSSYNRETGVAVMRTNASLMGPIGTAAAKGDFSGAAQNLMLIAQGMNKLLAMVPPKGSLEDWQKTLSTFVNTAYKGIGACAAQDQVLLTTAVNELKGYMKAGHAEFRF
jgi:hypothetical protein